MEGRVIFKTGGYFDTPAKAKELADANGYATAADANGVINLWKHGDTYHANRMVYNSEEDSITTKSWKAVESWLEAALKLIGE